MSNILDIKNLMVNFYTDEGIVTAVDNVSFYVRVGETLGIVGESGCGKSVTSSAIMRLIEKPGKIEEQSSIILDGKDILKLSNKELRKVRGNTVSMIFQEPMISLNPVFKIGDQICEILFLHQKISKKKAREKAIEMLKIVGIPRPEKVIDDYPHSLSGGMRQRAMIAMALACSPKLLIADEPTTALDVTIQAQILELMKNLKKDINASIILISHNMGVIAETCDRVIVMYAGQIVEEGDVHSIFKDPKHPYTIGLLKSIPFVNKRQDKLEAIPGVVPNPLNMPKGCRFAPRCRFASCECSIRVPQITEIDGRLVRCIQYDINKA